MQNIIGIRREDLSKKGEQRVAIVPEIVKDLSEKGFSFHIQSGTHPETQEVKRAFTDQQYADAHASITEDLSEAQIIFGLKEIEQRYILPHKTYLFFSHTHKGQIKNRPLLKNLVQKKATLIDYELINHQKGGRVLTAFTYFAGYAGMIDSLWTYGKRMSTQGKANLFSKIPQSIEKGNLDEIKSLIHELGMEIREKGTSPDLPPLIVCFLGNGKTSTGAQEIYDILPVKKIELEELEHIFEEGDRRNVYKLVLDIPKMFKLRSSSPYIDKDLSKKEIIQLYFEEPHHFKSALKAYFPYISILMNCILWSPKYPRMLSRDQAADWYRNDQTLKVVGDITCDPEGSIQFSKETWIDDPVFIYDPIKRIEQAGFDGDGIAVMAVTNLPCEFPADASKQFANELFPFLPAILLANYEAETIDQAGLPREIREATILWRGELTDKYSYMQEFLND
ncbi:MAG: hypothetical protein AAFY71_13480 [Bacteroidota bacterium]